MTSHLLSYSLLNKIPTAWPGLQGPAYTHFQSVSRMLSSTLIECLAVPEHTALGARTYHSLCFLFLVLLVS